MTGGPPDPPPVTSGAHVVMPLDYFEREHGKASLTNRLSLYADVLRRVIVDRGMDGVTVVVPSTWSDAEAVVDAMLAHAYQEGVRAGRSESEAVEPAEVDTGS